MGCEFCRESQDDPPERSRYRSTPRRKLSPSEEAKDEEWWRTEKHGVFIAISGPPCSGRGGLGSLLVNNLESCFLLRQEDYARGYRKDEGTPSLLCDNTKVDDHMLKKDVMEAAQHYKFVIVEGTWAFQDPALVKLMDYKVHLNMSEEECHLRLVGKEGAVERSEDSISEELFHKFFKPYFQDKKGYINDKVLPLTDDSSGSDVMIFYVTEDRLDLIQEAAERVLALVLAAESDRAPTFDGSNERNPYAIGNQSSSSSSATAAASDEPRTYSGSSERNQSASSSCAAAAASDEQWSKGRSKGASSSSEVAAN